MLKIKFKAKISVEHKNENHKLSFNTRLKTSLETSKHNLKKD